MPTRVRIPVIALLAALAAIPAAAGANTSHAGWPRINGLLLMNKQDQSRPLHGLAGRHNELLGGHGNDELHAGRVGDVLWGDYKPGGQPGTQVDRIIGGAGRDFIYGSHGTNLIWTGGGRDVVHVHFGRGEIFCGTRRTIVYISHRSRPHYRLHGCRRISYKTLGY